MVTSTITSIWAVSGNYSSSSSSGALVSCSTPSAVTAYEFSTPTAPSPGKKNFGSHANTMPSASGSFEATGEVRRLVDLEAEAVTDE